MSEHRDDAAVLEGQRTPPVEEAVEDRDHTRNDEPFSDEHLSEEHQAARDWLEDEFPEWTIEVGVGQTLSRENVRLWVARQEGHHPQSEQSAGKLYSRLTEYMEREERRFPSPN